MSVTVLSSEDLAYIKNLPNKELENNILLIGNEIVSLYSTQSCYLEELKRRKCYNRNYQSFYGFF